MSRQEIRTDQAPAPAGGYSQGIVAGDFVYTSGTVPVDPATGSPVSGGVAEQTRQVMRNLQGILAAHDLSFDDVVKTTVHLADVERDFKEFDAAYREFFTAPLPARTTVGSALLGVLVEIDVVAWRG